MLQGHQPEQCLVGGDGAPVPALGWTDVNSSSGSIFNILTKPFPFSAVLNGSGSFSTRNSRRCCYRDIRKSTSTSNCRLMFEKSTCILFYAIPPAATSFFDTNQRSDRLNQSCLAICECAAVFDTDPEPSPWAWYARAHHQYERWTRTPVLRLDRRNCF